MWGTDPESGKSAKEIPREGIGPDSAVIGEMQTEENMRCHFSIHTGISGKLLSLANGTQGRGRERYWWK